MSTRIFQEACEALWGPYYQSEAARQLKVGRSSIIRYDAGTRAVPAVVLGGLKQRLRQRRADIDQLLRVLP